MKGRDGLNIAHKVTPNHQLHPTGNGGAALTVAGG